MIFQFSCFRYFEDPELLNRIPSLFPLLGGIFAVLQITGLLLICEPKISDLEEASKICVQKPETSKIAVQKSETTKQVSEQGLTILQTIKRKDFILLWTIFMSVQVMQNVIENYHKSFGLKFIDDDFFFSYLGLTANIVNALTRLFWGFMFDLKGFKVKFV